MSVRIKYSTYYLHYLKPSKKSWGTGFGVLLESFQYSTAHEKRKQCKRCEFVSSRENECTRCAPAGRHASEGSAVRQQLIEFRIFGGERERREGKMRRKKEEKLEPQEPTSMGARATRLDSTDDVQSLSPSHSDCPALLKESCCCATESAAADAFC